MNRPEILAPAGSMESLQAAVNCGANAVYLGAKALNARRNAGNFDEVALSEAVCYAHLHGVKILQTLNIVMFDNEIDDLLRAAETAAKLGVDAAIVQDWGVLSLLKATVPELPLFASTQMAVHNLSGAKMAEEMGCKRVVLARELSAGEIAHIVQNISAQTEVFVHGALCMSVSGQCYLSSMLGGRSGNRGLCAQPCRLPFACASSSHALSLKDLSLIERVQELAALGVSSLKIEGRMKRPEYVAAAVTALRQALDGEQPDIDRLRSVFSRSGFTTGYFDSKRDRFMFGIRQKDDVTAATSVLGELAQLAGRDIGAVPVEGAFTAFEDEPISLALRDRDKNNVFVEGDVPQAAHTKPTDEARVRQSLLKTGGTPFHFIDLDIALSDGLMIPVSQLNALRREAFEQLSARRCAPHPHRFYPDRPPLPATAIAPPSQPALRIRCQANQLSKSLLDCCESVILPLNEVAEGIRLGVTPQRIIAEIPRILFTDEDQVAQKLKMLRTLGVTRAWCGNVGAVWLAKQAGLSVCGGWSLNLTNTFALQTAAQVGLSDAELSFELSLSQAMHLRSSMPLGLIAYGSLPLMTFRNCPVRAQIGCARCDRKQTLTDRKDVAFAVRCDPCDAQTGVSALYNSVPLYLADRRDELIGLSFVTLWFTGESPLQCQHIAAAYAGRADAAPPKDYTRGLYYRTVL
ncbi:DUF3656 domain-containing U32 family peptidase [Oscillospiraceae bacterium LTW-04]|nr:U32 family peptidase [Oscillospiraceae bacterium MB24-C1]